MSTSKWKIEQWVDAPPPKRSIESLGKQRLTRVGRIVEQLQRRPGQWALDPVPQKYGTSVAQRAQSYKGTEWTARRRPDGMYAIYGRYIGEPEPEQTDQVQFISPAPVPPLPTTLTS